MPKELMKIIDLERINTLDFYFLNNHASVAKSIQINLRRDLSQY